MRIGICIVLVALVSLHAVTGQDAKASTNTSVAPTGPLCPARPTRGFFDSLWSGVKGVVNTVTGAVSSVVNTAGNVAGWVFGGPWGVIVPSSMNKQAIRAACGSGFDVSKENLAGKVAGVGGWLIGSVWGALAPNSVNQGAIQSAQTMGQTDECVPVEGKTYQVDFTDAIRMSYSSVEERDRLLQAVVSAWNTIIKPYDLVGLSIYFVDGKMTDTTPCTIDVTYRITGLTKKQFDWITERPNFLNLFKTNPPPNMWPIPDITPQKTEVQKPSPPQPQPQPQPHPQPPVPVPPPIPQPITDSPVQAPGCAPLSSTSRVFINDDSDIGTLQSRLQLSAVTIAELRAKGFLRVSDLSLVRQIDMMVVLSVPRDRYLLRDVLFCPAALNPNNANHFFCQYYADMTRRCWNEFRAKTDSDAKYDKALNVVGLGTRIDSVWSYSDGIFKNGMSVGADNQIGSCTFEQSAYCAFAPPTGTTTNFVISSYSGQPGAAITASSGTNSVVTPKPLNTHFFCQFWTDLSTRCWNDYRAKTDNDTDVYDKAMNVVGLGDRVNGKFLRTNGIFDLSFNDVTVDWETPKQYGSCTFNGATASCANMPPAGCSFGMSCPGQVTFTLSSWTGQPGESLLGTRGETNIAV